MVRGFNHAHRGMNLKGEILRREAVWGAGVYPCKFPHVLRNGSLLGMHLARGKSPLYS